MHAYESTTAQLPLQEFGTCPLIQDLLPLYLEGEVSPSSRDTIVEHLARCERCAGFLAGAQSVRVQLRRDRDQRATVVQRDEPARQPIGALKRLVALGAVLGLCALGAISAVMIGASFDGGGFGEFISGVLIGLFCFGGLAGLARRFAPLTAARLLKLVGFCLIGASAPIFVEAARNPTSALAGLIMAIVALVGAWTTITAEAGATAA